MQLGSALLNRSISMSAPIYALIVIPILQLQNTSLGSASTSNDAVRCNDVHQNIDA